MMNNLNYWKYTWESCLWKAAVRQEMIRSKYRGRQTNPKSNPKIYSNIQRIFQNTTQSFLISARNQKQSQTMYEKPAVCQHLSHSSFYWCGRFFQLVKLHFLHAKFFDWVMLGHIFLGIESNKIPMYSDETQTYIQRKHCPATYQCVFDNRPSVKEWDSRNVGVSHPTLQQMDPIWNWEFL